MLAIASLRSEPTIFVLVELLHGCNGFARAQIEESVRPGAVPAAILVSFAHRLDKRPCLRSI
jgi:hypothetical protein